MELKKIKETESICPECLKKISADLVEENGQVMIKKNCPEHGFFEDIYWGNSEHYRWVMGFQDDGDGVENPRTMREKGCPFDCGICNEHKTQTVVGIVDVTNRCNLRCQICFANTGKSGYLYEPTVEQIREMLQNLRNNKPVPSFVVQFSGGEPTMRDDLPRLVRIAKELGFLYVMVDTNGIKIAEDRKYIKLLKDSGCDSFYLQFDGLDDLVYRKLRGADLLKKKLMVIENCRKVGFDNIVLVVTLVKGINDNQLGGIIQFALQNRDVIKCVNIQPLSFSGSASQMDIKKRRITTYDFIKLVEKQTNGRIKAEYFYPVPSIVPISRFVEANIHETTTKFSTHPCCGVGTYIIINDDGSYTPINELVDVNRFFGALKKCTKELSNKEGISKKLSKLTVDAELIRQVVSNVHDPRSRDILIKLLMKGKYETAGEFHRNSIMIGCMHFMDPWNFDRERVERCGVHYSIPNGKIIPFCSYNNLYRENIEKEFSVPLKK